MLKAKAKPKQVPIKDFAQEIAADLPALIQESPTGVYIGALQTYYGESNPRVMHACNLLAQSNLVDIRQAVSHAYYIVPVGYAPEIPFLELTPLQRHLLTFLTQIARENNTETIRTNHSQLARKMNCSYGGIKACIQRLIAIGHLEIVAPSLRGKQNEMIIRVIGLKDTNLPSDTK